VEGAVCRGCGPVTARVGERLWKAMCVEDDHLQVSSQAVRSPGDFDCKIELIY
jgi:hypothetical protein